MLTFENFTGINNMLPPERLSGADLLEATDVDIGLTGEISRRRGLTVESESCHKNVFEADGYLLFTNGNQLVARHAGGAEHVVHPAIGPERIWYCTLPDGRVTFSNGLLHGVTDGITGLDRSVPAPASLGVPDLAFGDLDRGTYRYYLTHLRLTDRAESPAVEGAPFDITNGGFRLDGLPELEGHAVQVYLSARDGEGGFLVGMATGRSFEWGGKNSALVSPCRTIGARAFPVGTITAFWRQRVLVAQGNMLWASRSWAPHLSDWRDFKAMKDPITMVQPVDDGIYVGTTKSLVFLAGTTWDALGYSDTKRGPVVLGSGVSAPGNLLRLGDGAGSGDAMLCIASGEVVAGFSGGQTTSLTDKRYRTKAVEVCAAFREVDGIPQYVAIPQ